MRTTSYRTVPDAVREAVVGWLPDSEFAASLLDDAGACMLVADARGAAVAVALVATGRMSLSGAPVVVACAGAPDGAEELGRLVAPRAAAAGRLEVGGPAGLARPLAEAVGARTDGRTTTVMDQRLMVATEPRHPAGVPGRGRRAAPQDRPLLGGWLDAFGTEALGTEPIGVEQWVRRLARSPWEQWVWEVDGAPVSLVNGRTTTPVSSRLGPVWTPPDRRGQGYAAACTALATEVLLGRGDERVTLFTDVANPTSNGLYARVGFVDVGAHGSWLVSVP